MLLNKLNGYFEFAVEAFDGVHGWLDELMAIIAFVIVFNFIIRFCLRRLHQQFEKMKKVWHDSFVAALYKPLSYYIWFFASLQVFDMIRFRVFGLPNLENKHLIIAVVTVLTTSWFLLKWKGNIVRHISAKSRLREITIDKSKVDVMDKILTVLICFLTVLGLLEATDRSVSTLIAFGGVGGLAIAIAAQEIIASFFGGFMIYLTHPFSIGDWVNLPEKSIEGHVEEIGWYMTRIRTFEKRPIYIPNSLFSKMVVVNPSRMTHRQFREKIGIRYSDLGNAKAIITDIKDMVLSHSEIDPILPTIVRLTSFGDYSVDILVSAYIRPTDGDGSSRVKEDIFFKIADIVKAHGADFAYPTSTIEISKTLLSNIT